jgi:hypothetical protein
MQFCCHVFPYSYYFANQTHLKNNNNTNKLKAGPLQFRAVPNFTAPCARKPNFTYISINTTQHPLIQNGRKLILINLSL